MEVLLIPLTGSKVTVSTSLPAVSDHVGVVLGGGVTAVRLGNKHLAFLTSDGIITNCGGYNELLVGHEGHHHNSQTVVGIMHF